MTKERALLKELWDRIHSEEIAGHFPHELLTRMDGILKPTRCSQCGGINVQIVCWVDPNTNEVGEDFGSWNELDTKWCADCDDHVALVDAEEESST